MEVVCDGTVLFASCYLRLVPGKLREDALWLLQRGFVVCICDICYCNGFGAVLLSYPVCIREINSYRCCRVAVSGNGSHIYHLCNYSLHLTLLEAAVYRGVILKPLGIVAYGLCSLGGFKILVAYIALPGSLAAKRVVVILHKTIYEIYRALCLLNPGNVVLVPGLEVSCCVVLYEFLYVVALRIILCKLLCIIQVADYYLQGLVVFAANLIYLLLYLAISLYKFAVEAVGWRGCIARLCHCLVKGIGLIFCNVAIVKVYGRCHYNILILALIAPL